MKSICRTLGCLAIIGLAVLPVAPSALAKPGYGTLAGIVLDPSGTPQMGATVWLISEDAGGRTVSQLLSNQQGGFSTDHLKPGKYAVRVSLAGFLPTMERHIAVMPNLTTLLRVQVDSIFASLDSLRRKSDEPAETDDWKWVLRSSTATRTVLQWRDDDPSVAFNPLGGDLDVPQTLRPRGLVQMMNGGLHPGASPSDLPDAPGTAVSYDQRLGDMGRLLLAGQMSYDRRASGAFAGVWLPSGTLGQGPETVFVMHQTKFGPDGLTFQGMRFDHTEQIALGDRVHLRAGAEYLRVGMVSSVTALRPHAAADVTLSPSWAVSTVFAANPPADSGQTDVLESAMASLDSLPTVIFHNGDPILEGGWHEEISLKHKLTPRSTVEAATFHDSARHQAIFGSGLAASTDVVPDAASGEYVYDGGLSSSWGTRVAYRNKVSDNLEFAAIYDWGGALSPSGDFNTVPANVVDNLATRKHHSVAGRVSGKIPRAGTQFSASYKWISGAALSRLDPFGESAYQLDPGMHVSIRQPFPGSSGRWVALADFTNLLAQGYVDVNGEDSRILFAPILRSFRGGVSFQF